MEDDFGVASSAVPPMTIGSPPRTEDDNDIHDDDVDVDVDVDDDDDASASPSSPMVMAEPTADDAFVDAEAVAIHCNLDASSFTVDEDDEEEDDAVGMVVAAAVVAAEKPEAPQQQQHQPYDPAGDCATAPMEDMDGDDGRSTAADAAAHIPLPSPAAATTSGMAATAQAEDPTATAATATALHNGDGASGGTFDDTAANHSKRKRDDGVRTNRSIESIVGRGGGGPSGPPASKRQATAGKRSRETKPPRTPRTAFELYTLKYKRAVAASKKNKPQQPHASTKASGGGGKSSSSVPTMAKIRAAYDKLGFREQQQWRIQQAEELLQYETQLATYAATLAASGGGPDSDAACHLLRDTGASCYEVASAGARGHHYKGARTASEGGPADPSFASTGVAPLHPPAAGGAGLPSSQLSLARSSFNDFVVELVRFKAEKGHCRIPVKKGGVLGKWVDKIRKEYKRLKPAKTSVTSSHASSNGNQAAAAAAGTTESAQATASGMEAAAAAEPTDLTIGDQLVYFSNAHGRRTWENGEAPDHPGVPENIRLDCFTAADLRPDRRRTADASGKTTTHRFERIKILTFLGMVWEFPNEDYEEIWQKHFRDLLEYKATHKNCNVPQKGFGRLSWWVKIQRELYVNTKGPKRKDGDGSKKNSRPRQLMPQHRIAQLESVGFEWRIRPPALKWEERYKELIQYKREVGDCNVPQNYPPNRVLGKWVMKQRGYYYDKVRGKKSPLGADRQSKLEAIGFCWVAPHVAKTKAKLPLREDIIKEQLRARDVVATVVAAATSQQREQQQHPPSPPDPVVASAAAARTPYNHEALHPKSDLTSQQQQQQQQSQHQQHQQQQQQLEHNQHHMPNPAEDPYHYHFQQPLPPHQQQQQQTQHQQHIDVTGAISYFGAPTTVVGNHPLDPQQQQPQHIGGLGHLDAGLLNHISPTEHYLARPLEHDPSPLAQQQQQQLPQQSPQQSFLHQQHGSPSPPQQQQQQQQHQPLPRHIDPHDGRDRHHAPQQQQHQRSPMMFHHSQQQQPPSLRSASIEMAIGSPGESVYPPYVQAPGVAGGSPPDAAGATSPTMPNHPQQQAQQQQQQQQSPRDGGTGVNALDDQPIFL